MAFTTMHFAVGMVGTGALAATAALLMGRGWRWVPATMTLGGIWACGPDLTRLFKEDFPNAPFASALGSRGLEDWLYARGDWFFFHRMLDEQPKEYALHGLIVIIALYTLCSLVSAVTHRSKTLPATSEIDIQPATDSDPPAEEPTERNAA